MKKLQKIEKGKNNCGFAWILENEINGIWAEQAAGYFRILIKKHNLLVDHINELEAKFLNEAKRADEGGE